MNRYDKADAKIRLALVHIERAQAELYEAMSELSPVLRMVDNWERAGKLGDQVKAFWHRVNQDYLSRRGEWELDDL